MSILTPSTNTAFQDATETSRPFIPTLILDTIKREAGPWRPSSKLGTKDAYSEYSRSNPTDCYPGQQPVALAELAKLLAEITHSFALPSAVQTKITLLPAWQPQLVHSTKHAEIIAVLRMFGLDKVADRLGYLYSLTNDDPHEPSIEIESLRAMALFLMGERQLPDPQIGVNPDGLIQIEWGLPANGILAMEFLPCRLIRFAAITTATQPGVEPISVNGTLPKEATLQAIQSFTLSLSRL